MFKNTKYTTIYNKIISKCQVESGEKHHIIPKSLGGSNKKENLVIVSPRVHFILHKLLCRMVIDEKHKRSMYFALFQMMGRKICKYSSRDYEKAKKIVSENMKKYNPMYNKETVSKFKGKHRPEQSLVALKRNAEYWKTKGRPIREFFCPVCSTPIITRIPTKTTCSKSCSAILQHNNK